MRSWRPDDDYVDVEVKQVYTIFPVPFGLQRGSDGEAPVSLAMAGQTAPAYQRQSSRPSMDGGGINATS